jgi:hypothetical protein
MICTPCKDQNCETCESVDCCCGHDGSTVRPLTHAERHEYMLDRRTVHLMPRDLPPVALQAAQPAGEWKPPAGDGT